MKKILTILLFLSVGTLTIMGCSLIFGATYSVSTDTGYCYEVTTSEASTIIFMEAAGAVKEPCDTENVAASCTFTSSEYNQETVNYYSAEYLASVPDLEDDCADDEGDWETY